MIKFTRISSYANKVPYIVPQQRFFGINPKIRYEYSDKYFNLPRFISKEMHEARVMNRLALQDIRQRSKVGGFRNASLEDLVRLTDPSSEASFLRVKWVNPKDGKAYYLLNNGKTDDGLQIVRILNSDGSFVKEAALNKKKIIVFECYSDKLLPNINNITHGELMTLFVKRYNPFVDVKLYYWKDKLEISRELKQELDKDTAAISCAFTSNSNISPDNLIKRLYNNFFNKRTKISKPEILKEKLAYASKELDENLSGIPSHVRIFMSAGNAGKNSYNRWLSLNNVEGVGSLDTYGKIAEYSSSRNSYFTQHYELGEFGVIQLPQGFKFTGTDEIDIPVKSNLSMLHQPITGTSIAVSIRAAKVVLNQMMEGLL